MEMKIGIIIVMMFVAMVFAENFDTEEEQKEYLKRYQYLGEFSANRALAEMTNEADAFKSAIENFQSMAGINITGQIDEETKRFMRMPRCGMADQTKDEDFTRKRKKRYAIGGQKWPKKLLTWYYRTPTGQMNSQQVRRIVKEAFDQWEINSGLSFREVSNPNGVDIYIDFARRDHGDNNAFDGRGNVLAHAYFPSPGIGGDAHFDEDEHWTDKTPQGTNLFQVAVHEFGHSLGLGHSKVQGAIMQAFYQGYKEDSKLHWDDVNGIQYLYGKPENKPPKGETPRPATRPTPSPPKRPSTDHYQLCKVTRIDAITSAENRILVFAGSKFFVVDGLGHDVSNVEAYDIKNMFYKITNKRIKFAYTINPTRLNTDLLIFADGQVWRYAINMKKRKDTNNYVSLRSGYPRSERREITGFPSGVDAGFVWKQNGNQYFFKGSVYYRKRSGLSFIDYGYPKSLRIWSGVPTNVDAVFSYVPVDSEDAVTFFFKGYYAYLFDELKDRVDYRNSATLSTFFGCDRPIVGRLEDWTNSATTTAFSILTIVLSVLVTFY